MIYLDVTSASQSALNTGVKRMQRGLHAWLSQRANYKPVVWQSVLGRYRLLDSGGLALLENPFDRELRGMALYDSFLPGLLGDIAGIFADRSRCLDWPAQLCSGDLLLVPDLLWDNRGKFFIRSSPPGARRVGIFHDAIALRNPEQSRIDALCCLRGVKALSQFDAVVCISRDAEVDLHSFWKKHRIRPAPTFVVPWPVPFHQRRPDNPSTYARHEVLYVARLEPHKNHLRLLEACEHLWREGVPLKLRLIGCKSYPDATGRILSRVNSLKSAGRDVRWAPHVSEEELHEAYKSCSFTAFPSMMEGFGLPIIESLWHGRPVVCGSSGAVAEVASGGGCVTDEMSDVTKIAAALRKVLTDESYYSVLCEEIAKRGFLSWDGYWRKLMAGLESMR